MSEMIFGAGAALVDLLIEESDSYLSKLGSEKGGMTMVEPSFHQDALDSTTAQVVQVPGGSACNTLVGIAQLGGQTSFLGNVGKDSVGKFFASGLKEAGVNATLSEGETPTGRVLSVVTPDAQRTMFTHLGASAELTPESLSNVDFSSVRLVHLEGYLAFNAPYFKAVVQKAREAGVGISLDLSSFEVVRFCRELLDEVLQDGIEILIANEDEAAEFAGSKEESVILEKMSKVCDLSVYKLGAEGVVLQKGSEVLKVGTTAVKALDTTGAGDLWASGFLFGYVKGASLESSAKLGNQVAGEVVQIMGAKISSETWQKLNSAKESLV